MPQNRCIVCACGPFLCLCNSPFILLLEMTGLPPQVEAIAFLSLRTSLSLRRRTRSQGGGLHYYMQQPAPRPPALDSEADWQASIPSFSQTIFRTGPNLGLGQNPESPRLVGGISLAVLPELASRWRSQTVTARAVTTSGSSKLPQWLVRMLQERQRDVAELFRGWEGAGFATVQLGQLAQGLRSCGVTLSDEELRQVVMAVEPSLGEPPSGPLLRLQQFDYKQLARAVSVETKRARSQYIRQASVKG